ncbi:MAG: hypothetical protein A2339_07995 [Elusimicrobia bacterium RIFOXYB12_FULL_50_12]|nr:MAG: hypothetical protein A2278_02730 [Elusimicrobia bacterium RIFOXYA12_FULL_49_49]OGS09977.1 MAG: hypothetical protein A2386_06290 [Elusimicrobia bacterium RIFOXYB1_FULL_48_9]OGS16396.1 MAG: hypothetical protein A2251_06185 [Elusimicrobia bacterium RIFOXYA2_FULL_47_53]OGS27227.1 MAG: hypothetical protein A2339_07995 [Elusimicrobia bacterium RIFOXYB12_FULL_50_12]OGS30427.1 MAG: hypothetical protein A2323_02855 [Elusimicrobia bacterium RIFOXYB2_FULL_46_23]
MEQSYKMNNFKLKPAHIILLATLVLATAAIFLSWRSPLSKAIRNGERINGVIIGTDWVDYARHSDTLIFVSYDPSKRFLDVISIPRDTHFSPAGYNFQKINEVYAYHYRTKKSDKAACHEVMLAVEQLFQDKAAIPYFVRVDYSSFKKFIDLVGGVDLDVEEPMNYDDSWGKLHIHFEPGPQHMNGQKALEYVRYRGAAGDIGRVYRQQRFMKAVVSRFKNPYNLFKLPKITAVLAKEIDTNVSLWDIFSGLIELKDLKVRNIRFAQLPGAPKRNYWEVDIENSAGLMEKIIPSSSTVVSQGPKIRIEVWNASGKNGLAEEISWILRKQGFDVIDWGTFSVRQKKTLIKDLKGDIRSAQRIAEILSCGEVVTRFDERKLVNISVILGEDSIPVPGALKREE